jgi:hypothetical protein
VVKAFVTRHWIPALGLLLLCTSGSAHATTLVQVTLDELVNDSELIFTGEVVDSAIATEGELVYTTVRFAVDDVIAGDLAGDSVELRFLGGVDGARQTDVSGQFIPAPGARGLYFVGSTTRDLVNPLIGWSQGYFPLVDTPDGVTWLDLKDHPDYGLLAPDTDPLAGKMRGLNFTREQIAERFPERFRYPLADFILAIDAMLAEQGE